jgi:hypothetical protein
MSGMNHHPDEWVHSERRSFRLALAIALMPIPLALVISWLLGDAPWSRRSSGYPPGAIPTHSGPRDPADPDDHGHGIP